MDDKDKDISQVMFAVSADSPEWMQSMAGFISRNFSGTHGCVLALCKGEGEIAVTMQEINTLDLLALVQAAVEEIRDSLPGGLADYMIEKAISEKGDQTYEEP